MDVLFDGLEVTLPARENEPITMGLTSGYDFFGGHAVYVEGFAQDTACKNSIRSLTDKEIVKHVGDVEDFGSWWESILAELEQVADDLFGFIEDAQDITIDFTDVPFSVTEFYELLDFPSYLAERAASDAEANAPDPFRIDMWTLHSGATYALTHFFKGKEGNSLDRYVRTANDVLFNPQGTVEKVEKGYEQVIGDAGEHEGLHNKDAVAQIESFDSDLQTKAQEFEDRKESLNIQLE